MGWFRDHHKNQSINQSISSKFEGQVDKLNIHTKVDMMEVSFSDILG